MGTTDGDAGLHGSTNVVGVDVAVPNAVAAHHDDGVPEGRPGLLEALHGFVRGIQEVHHLVLRAEPGVTAVLVGVVVDQQGRRHLDRFGDGASVDGREDGVQQEQEPAPARVHHPGLG